jgi:hypothetical protein
MLEYTNRKGDRYYVLQGRTKTGKPKYYCSRSSDGLGVDRLPDDFEIHENPRSALVSVRKVKPSRLAPFELEFLKEQVRKLSPIEHVIVERTADSFIVYTCDCTEDGLNKLMDDILGPRGRRPESGTQWYFARATYSPAFRFTLIDENERLFHAERWCYLGSIDGWILICFHGRALDELAETFLPHLGQESFFELI